MRPHGLHVPKTTTVVSFKLNTHYSTNYNEAISLYDLQSCSMCKHDLMLLAKLDIKNKLVLIFQEGMNEKKKKKKKRGKKTSVKKTFCITSHYPRI